ncbi:MAG: hypothetical protein K5663_01110 [Clostridiales bacterium]|nr:hypothetical protein [Clostridiales bacterium]
MRILLAQDNLRLRFGAEKLADALLSASIPFEICVCDEQPSKDDILVCVRNDCAALTELEALECIIYNVKAPEGEAFQLETCAGGGICVIGGSPSGALYGCVELARRIRAERALPIELLHYDEPEMTLRGICVGLQKTTIEPPRRTYEYPITPERFKWFYDREMWLRMLDFMLENRANVLYLWSGHPFSSLQKLEKYPEALEVTEEEYLINRETFLFLASECDKRGIWLVLKFYNIHIPLPFAQKHGLSLIQDSINPIVRDYTYEAIKEFVREYPNVGLMVCLGEALRGADNKAAWFADTIVPAVKEGARLAGLAHEPPIILRGHDCDPDKVLSRVKNGYSNIYTMWKYNGEGLTTRLPRGKWRKNHLAMSGLGNGHIINVHILSNLEPFRFLSPMYIRQCILASKNLLGGTGLHLYPQFYWDWPYSPDKTTPRLDQLDRDRLWFEPWLRYAWVSKGDESAEGLYWIRRVSDLIGLDFKQAESLLKAGELAGFCLMKLLQRFGITEGNRQTLTLGMTMSQLTNAERHHPNNELYNSVARVGETMEAYAISEHNASDHIGETPLYALQSLKDAAARIEQLVASIDESKAERYINDFRLISLFTRSMCEKVTAALYILKYKHSCDSLCRGDVKLLETVLIPFERSLQIYKEYAVLSDQNYLCHNSMHTPQRKIPFPNGGIFARPIDCLPEYEKEFACFIKNLDLLKQGFFPTPPDTGDRPCLRQAEFSFEGGEAFTLSEGESVFTDKNTPVELIASELNGLKGIRFSIHKAIVEGISLKIQFDQPVRLLVGYVNDRGVEWLAPPSLETDTHADDRGGYSPLISNAIKARGIKAINIHAFDYDPGDYMIEFGTGAFVIAGVLPRSERPQPRDAGLGGESLRSLDWLYETDVPMTL